MQFTNTVEIRRSVHDVFAYLTDFRNIPKWNYAIAETQQSPGPVGIGTTIRQSRSLPSPSVEMLDVVEFVPDQRLALRGALGPFDGVMVYELGPHDGGTLLTNTADLRARGLAALAAALAAARVRDAVGQNLGVLKTLLEADG